MYDLIKAVSLLVYPLGFFFLLALAGLTSLLLGRRRLGGVLMFVSVGWLWAWSMPVTSERLRSALEARYPNLPAESAPVADAIVVLGGAFSFDSSWPYPSAGGAVDRYWHGARLYHAGRAPTLVLSGGRNQLRPQNPTEAESGAVFLQDMGVPESALLLDNASRTTHDQVRYLEGLLAERGLDRLLVVTSATHMRRAEAVFRLAGLDIHPVATDFSAGTDRVIGPRRYLPSLAALGGSTQAVHEHVGYLFYRLRGWV